MGTMLKDDIDPAMLDQFIERVNLRSAWRARVSNILHGHLSPAAEAHLQAECLRVFGPRWEEDIAKENPWHVKPTVADRESSRD